MARVLIAHTQIDRGGAWPAVTNGITDGHMFANDGRVFVYCQVTGAEARMFTFVTPLTIDGLAVTDLIIDVTNGAGNEVAIGPFPENVYNQKSGADSGRVYIDYETFGEQDIRILRL